MKRIKLIAFVMIIILLSGCDSMITETSREDGEIIEYFSFVSYPNPFCPITTISFILVEDSHVLLEIFDSSNHKVAELMNRFCSAGCYQVVWNAENLSSDVFIAKLQAGDEVAYQKIVLVR